MTKRRSGIARDTDGPSERRSAKKEVDWGGFFNVRMTDADKAAFDVWREQTAASLWTMLDQDLADGFKMSVVYDAPNECFVVSYTGEGQTLIGVDARMALSARAPDWTTALHLLLYKHHVMVKRKWEQEVSSTTKFNFG